MTVRLEHLRPLAPLQRMLWLMDQYRGGSGVMNVPIVHRLTGDVDIEALAAAVGALADRHEALRTAVVRGRGGWAQGIRPRGAAADLVVHDLRGRGADALDQAVTHRLSQDMDLAESLPYTADLYRVTDREHVLMINVHHLITDAWSNALIRRDVAALYNAARGGAVLPAVDWQYRQALDWQEQHLTGDVLVERQDFWRSRLSGFTAPLLRPAPARRRRSSPPSGNEWMSVDGAELRQLTALAARYRTSTFVALTALFLAVLRAETGRSDIGIGSVFANRARKETHETVGLFANMVLLRVRVPERCSFADLLRLTRATVLEALDHQDFPYMTLPVRELRMPAGRPENVVFHMLAVPPGVRGASGFHGLDDTALPLPEAAGSRFDMELLVFPGDTGADGCFRYAADQFPRDYVRALAGRYRALVPTVLADPDAPLRPESA
ncbi:condensation domain-containing protein [Streptomyces sp. NPDC059629]|uniref:condensation domain-containing protein n=1 Tax=Streptomyces sp. NPDC059629 TaxID=3346889 RepID=UPI00369806A7